MTFCEQLVNGTIVCYSDWPSTFNWAAFLVEYVIASAIVFVTIFLIIYRRELWEKIRGKNL